METFISDLSKKEFPKSEKISAQTIRPSVLAVWTSPELVDTVVQKKKDKKHGS